MVVRFGSWNARGSSKIRSLFRTGDTFEGVTYALIVFEFFGAVGLGISAMYLGMVYSGEMLTLHYRPALYQQRRNPLR